MNKGKISGIILRILLIGVWGWVFIIYQPLRTVWILLGMAAGIRFAKSKALQTLFITFFVIFWMVLFHYESVRHFYLNPYVYPKIKNLKVVAKLLPEGFKKTKFLFPPAGWIMFFRVTPSYGNVEIIAIDGQRSYRLDPHQVLLTRDIMYDNVYRGVLGSFAENRNAPQTCRYLKRRFPEFDNFIVRYHYYRNVVDSPYKYDVIPQFQCK